MASVREGVKKGDAPATDSTAEGAAVLALPLEAARRERRAQERLCYAGSHGELCCYDRNMIEYGLRYFSVCVQFEPVKIV